MTIPPQNILFLGLTAFSQTGGLEKFNKCLLKALLFFKNQNKINLFASVLHDNRAYETYFSNQYFKGYQGKRYRFVLKEILHARKFTTILVGHINLSIITLGIKKFFPDRKVIMVIHGKEVMHPVNGIKKKALLIADEIWTVSHFTKNCLVQIQGIAEEKIKILHNTLDPHFKLPGQFDKPAYLTKRYNLSPDENILFTLTRLDSHDGYKGYDKVIKTLPEVLKSFPTTKYFIAGKGDEKEIEKVNKLIAKYRLQNQVHLLGFIAGEELTDHFLLSDVFVMPSKGEGFGIVFLEAMACGLPVIAGNKDGSVDALKNGKLGTLVNPDDIDEIANAIEKNIFQKCNPLQLQQNMLQHFSFEKYMKDVGMLLCLN